MAATDAASSSETPADFGTDPGGVAQRWISEITLAERDQEAWKTRARAIIKLYRADQKDGSADVKQRRFSLLWSNPFEQLACQRVTAITPAAPPRSADSSTALASSAKAWSAAASATTTR